MFLLQLNCSLMWSRGQTPILPSLSSRLPQVMLRYPDLRDDRMHQRPGPSLRQGDRHLIKQEEEEAL